MENSQMKMMKIQTILIACILLVVLAIGVFLAVQFSSVGKCVDVVVEKLEAIDAEKLNDAIGAFSEAAEQFNEMDIDKINDSISSLQKAAENLGKVDIEQLNLLVESLNATAEKLQNAVNAITGIFSFGK